MLRNFVNYSQYVSTARNVSIFITRSSNENCVRMHFAIETNQFISPEPYIVSTNTAISDNTVIID